MTAKTVRTLELLGKIKRNELVDKQRALFEMQVKLMDLNTQVKGLAAERQAEIDCGREDTTSRFNLQVYLDGLRKKERALKKQLFQLADFMIPVQESVLDSYRDIKSLELTKESLQNQIRSEEDKKEQTFLDEISIQSKARKHD